MSYKKIIESIALGILSLLMVGGMFGVTNCGAQSDCISTSQAGSCCFEDTDCGAFVCLQAFPQGYCSRNCGDDHQCSQGAHCINVNYRGDGMGGVSGNVCLVTCGVGYLPCREGYKCRQVGQTGLQVCFPS